MGEFVRRGGYVVTSTHSNYVSSNQTREVSADTLRQIAVYLGIPPADINKLADDDKIKTIFIYAPPE